MSPSPNTRHRSWQEIIDAVSRESDPKGLHNLALELERALEERDQSLGLQHTLNQDQLGARAEQALAESRSVIEQLGMTRAEKQEAIRRILENWSECVNCARKTQTQGKNHSN